MAASAGEPVAFFNGQVVPAAAVRLGYHDAGIVWGATITDLCRTFHHRLYRWEDHLARFRRGCRYAHISLPWTDAELTAAAHQIVVHNAGLFPPPQELALVTFSTPGPIGYYAGAEGAAADATPTVVAHTFPIPYPRYRPLFAEGARLVVPKVRHVPPSSLDPRIKMRSRLFWWLAEQEARQHDSGASALLLDEDGHVTETAAANFLIVRHEQVLSPPRATVLEGVSLQVVRELCEETHIPFAEEPLTLEDCLKADEAMLASTAFCLAGVSRINGQPIPWPGSIFERLLARWSQMVHVDIAKQMCAAQAHGRRAVGEGQ